MKKVVIVFLILSIFLFGCGRADGNIQRQTQEFTDSTGRTLTIPANITKIAITGPLSQIYILPLAGDLLVGVSNAYAEDAQAYLPDFLQNKPEIGQLYGGKGEMDLEALLAAAPDIVIDIGEPKKTTAADLSALTQQTGIPFIHIDATIATAPEAYRTLGKLLGRGEKAEALAISKQLRELTLVVTAKGGGAGRLFGSVTSQEIADALKAKAGITLDKRKIVIADTIKSVGTYTVTCKLGYEISAPLTVKIEEA